MTLTGIEAIEYAAANGLTLNKYNDPTEDAREGVTVEEARKIAQEDAGLLWISAPSKPADNLEVVFDNGGGITVQCDGFVHAYDDGADAAREVRELMAGVDPSDWEGHEPDHRIEYTSDQIRNGGYEVFDTLRIAELIAAGIEPDQAMGYSQTEFFLAMGAKEIVAE